MLSEILLINGTKKEESFCVNFKEIKKTLRAFGYNTDFHHDEKLGNELSDRYKKKVRVLHSKDAYMIMFYNVEKKKICINVCSKEDYDETVRECLEGE